MESNDLHQPIETFQVHRSTPWVTYGILGINIALFIIMTLAGGTEKAQVLLAFGAKEPALIWQGEYWRLLTSVFLHAGIAHMAFNTYALLQLGRLVELLYGHTRLAALYVASGVMASAASVVGTTALSVGASGAIFGLFGSLLYFGWRHPQTFKRVFGHRLFIILGMNLVIGFTVPRIDNYAHIGGLISGFLVIFALDLRRDKWTLIRPLLIAAMLVGFLYYALFPSGSSWRYHYATGRALLDRNQPEQAVEHLEQAVNLKPGQQELRLGLANACYQSGRQSYVAGNYPEAAQWFTRANSVYPTADGHMAAGWSYAASGQLNRAIQEAETALTLEPGHRAARELLEQLRRP